MKITLYEMGTTRSARCRWTLLELGLPFDSVDARPMLHTDELRALSPMGKAPAILINGEPLFESCAISTALADACPEKELIAPSGSRERALHEQWMCFTLSELEAWLWHSFKHTARYPEEERLPAAVELNGRELAKGLAVVDNHLGSSGHMVGDRFSVTDIITAFSLNWARRTGHTDGFAAVNAYLDRLYSREHCVLSPPA